MMGQPMDDAKKMRATAKRLMAMLEATREHLEAYAGGNCALQKGSALHYAIGKAIEEGRKWTITAK